MDDSQAIDRLRQNDVAGLEILFARYQVKALRTAFLITQDEALAEDAVQDTFLHFFDGVRRFDTRRPFEPYLLRAVVNRAINLVEKNRRNTSLDGRMEDVEAWIERAASVEDQVAWSERKRQLSQALSQLPPRQRAVLVQRYYLGLSDQQIMEALSAPPGTVKWLLDTARKRLRSLLNVERRNHASEK